MALRKTRAELRTAVRDNLDETSSGFWTDDQLNRMLNRAKDRVWMEVRKVKDDFFDITRSSTDGALTILGEAYNASSFALAVGTRDYTLPPDVAEVALIEVITTSYEDVRFIKRALSHPDMRSALALREPTSPGLIYFALLGERTLRIAPMVDVALDIRLTYTAVVPDLASEGDTLEMPHPLYKAVEEYATASALKMDRDPNAAAWEATGNASLATFFGAHARQTQDPEFVTPYLGDW